MRASTNGTQDSTPAIAHPDHPHAIKRRRYWAVAAGAIAIMLAVFVVQRDRHGVDQDPPPPPQDGLASQAPVNGTVADGASATPTQAAPVAATSGQAAPDAGPATAPAAIAVPPAPAPAATSSVVTPPPAPAAGATSIPAAGALTKNAANTAGANPNASATYRLQIQPWGTIYVDGIDRGVSPPIKRLVLAPGRHTVRVTNPNFHERVLDIDTANGDGRIAVDFSDAD